MNREEEIKKLFDQITGMTPDIKMEYLPNGRIKIDKYFFLESLFLFIILASFIAFLTVLLLSGPVPLLSIPVVFFILSIFLLKKTDSYYIIDTVNKKILYHFSFPGLSADSEKYSFHDLLCLTVNGKRGSVKGIKYWSYYLTLITKQGKLIPLSEPKKDIDTALYDEPAGEIAEIFKIPYKKAEPGKELKKLPLPVKNISDLKYREEDEIDRISRLRTVVITILVIALFIVSIVYRDLLSAFFDSFADILKS